MTIISIDDFPEEASERENIVILSQEDFNTAMQSYESGKFLLDEKVCYMVKPDITEAKKHPILKKVCEDKQLKSGAVLLQDHTNDNRYLPYESVIKNSLQEQLVKFVELCQLMGAKEVKFEIQEDTTENRESSGNAGSSLNNISNVESSIENKIIKEYQEFMQHTTNFTGNMNPDIEKAQRLINTGIFDNNHSILSFFNIAKNIDNRMCKQEVTIKLAEKFHKSLAVLANIDAPILKKSIGEANFARIQGASKISSVKYTVFF